MTDALAGLVAGWPPNNVAVSVVTATDIFTHGDIDRDYRVASVSKLLTAYAALVAVEEGTTSLDAPVGQDDCTLEHLLTHAGGYPFEGTQPVIAAGRKRIYSNTGYDMIAAHIEARSSIPFARYLRESVCEPLGMTRTLLAGSAAKDVHSTVLDLTAFVSEMRRPTLLSQTTWLDATTPHFPDLEGIVPGVGRFSPCWWGLGPELKGHKHPHWLGERNSASTFGHFGGAGTFVWVDPVADVGCVMLSDLGFDEWGLTYWPTFNDAIVSKKYLS
jgi:CubicO group peptidase (beta-lactamase class C family)